MGPKKNDQQSNDFITYLRDQYIAAQSIPTGKQENYNNMLVDTRGNWVLIEIEGDRTCLGLTVSDVKRLIEQLNDWIIERKHPIAHTAQKTWRRRSCGNIGRQEIGIEETLTIARG